LLLSVSCKKETTISVAHESDVGVDVRLYDIQMINDTTWLACGGIRDKEGWLFRTTNAGLTWEKTEVDFPKAVYCLSYRQDGVWWAGGDFLHLWKSTDGGVTWKFHWLGQQVPFNGEDRPGVRQWQWISEQKGWFVGGENFGEGVIYHTDDGGDTWSFAFHQHELRALHFFNDSVGVVAGHGASFFTEDGISAFDQNNFQNDFMTDIATDATGDIIGVGYNGGIYNSSDFGMSWNNESETNGVLSKRANWNDVKVTNDFAIVCGNNGKVGVKEIGGNWRFIQLDTEDHLYHMAHAKNKIIFCTDHGRLLSINVSQLD
ncbi:MAG: hypothetical protein JNM00_12100, partial [Flavobacteriales bacterium]|nr:hypothetical protein [Flavobacteriales bacterium]